MKEDMFFGQQEWNFRGEIKESIDEFLELYRNRPIQNNVGGMTSTHLFWTWWALRKLNPENIIESGVFKGQGTWLMRKACPNAHIFSIDPILEQRVYVDERVEYFTNDFSQIEWEKYLNPKKTVCFFDDHQNAYNRLLQMKWMGFQEAMFEDNYPPKQGDCYSVKKICAQKEWVIDSGEWKTYPPISAHLEYLKRNLSSYTTFPPLFKNETTRWGDCWDKENYPTPQAIFEDEEREKYPELSKEAGGYTWICHVRLK